MKLIKALIFSMFFLIEKTFLKEEDNYKVFEFELKLNFYSPIILLWIVLYLPLYVIYIAITDSNNRLRNWKVDMSKVNKIKPIIKINKRYFKDNKLINKIKLYIELYNLKKKID